MHMKEIENKGKTCGGHWCTCVADGEALLLDHHVTWTWSLFVLAERAREIRWMSGQPCLSSYSAEASQ